MPYPAYESSSSAGLVARTGASSAASGGMSAIRLSRLMKLLC
jgi:hypothetical protein